MYLLLLTFFSSIFLLSIIFVFTHILFHSLIHTYYFINYLSLFSKWPSISLTFSSYSLCNLCSYKYPLNLDIKKSYNEFITFFFTFFNSLFNYFLWINCWISLSKQILFININHYQMLVLSHLLNKIHIKTIVFKKFLNFLALRCYLLVKLVNVYLSINVDLFLLLLLNLKSQKRRILLCLKFLAHS